MKRLRNLKRSRKLAMNRAFDKHLLIITLLLLAFTTSALWAFVKFVGK